jgi:GH15 family glucan-1,4-alpha-glucosidase
VICDVERTYPPISDYALIGDTKTGALVSRSGSLDWCCLPDFDSPSVFGALLDRLTGGRLHIGPTGESTVRRRYLDPAPILETRFETDGGVLRVTDFMPRIENTARRTESQREVLRLIEVERGAVEVDILYAPRPNYGKAPRIVPDGPGLWTIRSGREVLFLHSDQPLEVEGDRAFARATLEAGAQRIVALAYERGEIGVLPSVGPEARQKLQRTHVWWDNWAAGLETGTRYREAVLRSAQVLRLLSFGNSGAVLAAPTMALPEIMGGTLNWDYRYCWLRDAAYILQAFAGVGRAMEAQPFLRWLLHATRMTSPRLATVYDVYGRTLGREQILSRFEGYRGSGPVRLGNAAHGQLQLDVWGSLIRAADHFARHGGKLDVVERRILRDLGEHVCRIWREPDDGIWEKRGPRRHTTYGKAMCWSALDTLLDMARRGLIEVPVDRFAAEADRIRDHVLADGWNSSRRAYTAAFGHDDLDASVLTLPILGIVEATHPRMVATFERIDEELGHGALIDRYAPPNPDRREGSSASAGSGRSNTSSRPAASPRPKRGSTSS